tara:strand:+ start:62 stop:277 length:216 start_codon:yes stop_codon:yes gene_type:complete
MEKDTKYHVVIKPETGSKLKFSQLTKKITKKETYKSQSLPKEMGFNFMSSDEMNGMPAVREERILKFKDFL